MVWIFLLVMGLSNTKDYGGSDDLERSVNRLTQLADTLLRETMADGYSVKESKAVCKRLVVLYEPKLKKLSKELLAKTNLRLGLVPTPEQAAGKRKDELCQQLTTFYYYKYNVAMQVKEYTDRLGCRDHLRSIRRNMDEQLEGATPEMAEKARRMRDDLATSLSRHYTEMGDLLTKATGDVTMADLEKISVKVGALVDSGYSICCDQVEALRLFTWEREGDEYYNFVTGAHAILLPNVAGQEARLGPQDASKSKCATSKNVQ